MKKNKETNNKSRIIFAVGIAIIILINIYILIFNFQTARELAELEVVTNNSNEDEYIPPSLNISNDPLSIEGFSKVNISVSEQAVIVQKNCTAIGLVTHDIQLYSIAQGIEKTIDLRPTIHDTTKNILDNFNISILMVKITDAKDDLYFANIYLQSGNDLLSIDAKPSDAIALALRAEAPIYVKDEILEGYGNNVC